MLLATGKQSADADKRVCDKNNSLSKASSEEYPKYQYPFLLDIVFLQSAFYCPFIVLKKKKAEKEEETKPTHKLIHQNTSRNVTFPSVKYSCPYTGSLLHFSFKVSLKKIISLKDELNR